MTTWYASGNYLMRLFKWCVYEDTGSLEAEPGRILFRGKKGNIDCRQVTGISLKRQRIPWLSVFLSTGLVIGAVSIGLYENFTWQSPATIPMIVAVTIFFGLSAGPVEWVEVEAKDERGKPSKAYFIDSSGLGFSRFFGATRRLRESLLAEVMPSSNLPA